MVKSRTKNSAQQASSRRAAQKAKKLKKAERKKQAQSVPALLEAAATAMARLDVEAAYQSYSQAAVQLQQQQEQSVTMSPTQSVADGGEAESFSALELVTILEKMGEIQVSMGDPDLARAHFEQALKLVEEHETKQPFNNNTWQFLETHASLCLYIGQVSMELGALHAYLRGVASLEKCFKLVKEAAKADATEAAIVTTDDDDDNMGDASKQSRQRHAEYLQQIKRKLSGAYCNLADLYLTDLCEGETAESDCNYYLEKALQLHDAEGEPFVDALQTMANLRLSQQEKQHEAVPLILRAYEKHRVGYEALAALVGLSQDSKGKAKMDQDEEEEEQAKELLEVEAANNLPEFEFRCQTAKILLECADICKKTNDLSNVAKCTDAAISVLGSLLAQNDEVVEIWYLTGCAFAAKSPPIAEAAQFYLDHAKEMLTEVRKNMQQELEFVDDEAEQDYLQQEIETNSAQMQDVMTKLEELGLVGAAKDDGDAAMKE